MNNYHALAQTYVDIGNRLRHIGCINKTTSTMLFTYDAIMHQATRAAHNAERASVQLSRLLPDAYVDVQLYTQIIKQIILSNHRTNSIDIAFPYICAVRDHLVREEFRLGNELNMQRARRAMAA